MITQILQQNRKFFVKKQIKGEFPLTLDRITITGDTVPKIGQYICIRSDLNFSVCRVENMDGDVFSLLSDVPLTDDIITHIALLAIPTLLVCLSTHIEAYSTTESGKYVSESWAGWNGTKATGKNGVLTWQEKFNDALNPYKSLFTDLENMEDDTENLIG